MMGYSTACLVAVFNVEISPFLTFLNTKMQLCSTTVTVPWQTKLVMLLSDSLKFSKYIFALKCLSWKRSPSACFVRCVCSQDLRALVVKVCNDIACTFVTIYIRCKPWVLCDFAWHSYEILMRSHSESPRNFYVLQVKLVNINSFPPFILGWNSSSAH